MAKESIPPSNTAEPDKLRKNKHHEKKTCPKCGRGLLAAYVTCPYCTADLPAQPKKEKTVATPKNETPEPNPSTGKSSGGWFDCDDVL